MKCINSAFYISINHLLHVISQICIQICTTLGRDKEVVFTDQLQMESSEAKSQSKKLSPV